MKETDMDDDMNDRTLYRYLFGVRPLHKVRRPDSPLKHHK